MATRSVTLHGVSTLHFGDTDPSVLRPILQILSFAQRDDIYNRDIHLILSDGIHCLRAVVQQGPSASGLIVSSLRVHALIKLTDFVCPPSLPVVVRAFEIISMDQPRLGRPYPVENAPNPLQQLYASGPSFFALPSSPQSQMPYSSPSSSATSESSGLASCPSSPLRDVVKRPSTRPLPNLPLELQMIIIKDTIELYRQDEKRASLSGSSKSTRTGSQQAVQRLARIVGMEPVPTEGLLDWGSGVSDWSMRDGAMARMTGGDRHPDEPVEEFGKWGLALVSRAWNAIASPLLYRNIQLSQPASYALLASLLTSTDPTAPPVGKWIKRAVLRDVPVQTWADKETDVGRVMSHLSDLEVFKVRYKSRPEAVESMTVPLRLQPDVWEIYPNANPKVYHQHHLHTFSLPRVTTAWPRLRQTSSDFLLCLSHPPPLAQKFPSLPLRSHHLTIHLAGDPARLYRLPRLLHRLGSTSHIRHFVATIRCGSAAFSSLVLDTLAAEQRLRGKVLVEVAHHTASGWITKQVVFVEPAKSQEDGVGEGEEGGAAGGSSEEDELTMTQTDEGEGDVTMV